MTNPSDAAPQMPLGPQSEPADRGHRASTRRAATREEDVRPEAVREDEPRKRRRRRGAFQNIFGIDQEILVTLWNEYGVDLQWNLHTVKGAESNEVSGLPSMHTRVGMEQQGWESVMPGMFDGLLDGLFTRKDHEGEIITGGQVLQWRPRELTLEARAEDREMAGAVVGRHEQAIRSGEGIGVDTKIMTPHDNRARGVSHLTKTRVPTIPVPQ